ncbi:MAG: hypothetical protein FJ387_15560 [Verrucomicrobia bacterium]|nr:hypothetical protein [Verrucomicrobiota bacterium]
MSLLRLFRSKPAGEATPVQCPFCLQVSPAAPGLKQCRNPGCGEPLPVQYLRRYGEAPPLFLPMMGMPNAGKTNFLIAATVAVVSGNQFWQDLDYWPLTDETDAFIEKIERSMRTGVLPGPTEAKDIKKVYVLQLLRLPRWSNRTWVLRDVPGEHFKDRKIQKDQVPFVIHAKTSFLFFDLNGANEKAGNKADGMFERNIDRVFRAYIMGLEDHGVVFGDGNDRRVVVVLTKADQLDLPAHLKKYLWEDEHWDSAKRGTALTNGGAFFDDDAMARYMDRLRRVDAELKEWVVTQPGGRSLVSAAELTNRVELHFCMISAIPCGVQRSGQSFEPRGKWQQPLRILDPCYWALELNSRPAP